MVSHGDPSDFNLTYCVDCRANRHVSTALKAFIANYRAANTNITVAKQNRMQAVGVGDCEAHVVDNMGCPFKLVLKDVLYVTEAGKNLMSSYCIGKDGYQAVLACENVLFPPGIYCPLPACRPLKADSAQQPKYVPLQLVNGLNYLSSRAEIGSSPPIRTNHPQEPSDAFSSKLGHMP